MRTLRTLKPGWKRTKDLLARRGESLPCVWYRYDEDPREHLKTVELIAQLRSRERKAECPGSWKLSSEAAFASSRRVAVRIGWRDLQPWVQVAGGRWDTG